MVSDLRIWVHYDKISWKIHSGNTDYYLFPKLVSSHPIPNTRKIKLCVCVCIYINIGKMQLIPECIEFPHALFAIFHS
jgi:hypothetical protein